jgi:large subunit ribosomal protein L24
MVAGKDRGKRGKLLRVVADDKVIVENVNVVKRHTKPNPQRNTPGGIIDKEMPVHASNVMLWNPVSKKGDRVGFRTLEDGRKVRYFKSTDELVDI